MAYLNTQIYRKGMMVGNLSARSFDFEALHPAFQMDSDKVWR